MSDGVPTPARSGATLGAYDILRVLERGVTETVYLAVKAGSDREVAIKVAAAGFAPPSDQQQNIAISKSLVHRHIARVLDSGEDGGLSYVVVERLQGKTISELIADPDFTWDLPASVDLVAQVCMGLHYAHERGLVHGNLTPANVFLTADNVAKVLNFGVPAAPTDDKTVVSDNALAGSFEYMSPEQLEGRRAVDGRSDVFSAAVILYQLIAERRPFDAPSPTATVHRILHDEPPPLDVAPKLHAAIRRALEKNAEKRFNAQEFAYALWMAISPDGDVLVEENEGPQGPPSETLFVDRGERPEAPEHPRIDAALPAAPIRTPLVYVAAAIVVTLVGVGMLLYAC
jgi:serine/threonine-protein kinase